MNEAEKCPTCGGDMLYVAVETTEHKHVRAEQCPACGYMQERTIEFEPASRGLGVTPARDSVRPIQRGG